MAVVKILARGYKIEVEAETPGTFVEIGGVESFSLSRSKTDTDTTSFDEEGVEEHLPVARTASVSMDVFVLEDQTSKSLDPGQAAVEALAEELGGDGIGKFKITSPAGTVKAFSGSVVISDLGGGKNDAAKVKYDITVSGGITTT